MRGRSIPLPAGRVLLGLLLGAIAAAPAPAEVAYSAKFALHRKAPTSQATTICTSYSPNADNLSCWTYYPSGPAPGASLVYVVLAFAPWDGVLGVSFGVDYNGRAHEGTGIDPSTVEFIPCFDGMVLANDGGFGDFPAPKGGARVTAVTCQGKDIPGAGVHAVIGAFYLYAYSPDSLHITPNNNVSPGPELAVVSCDLYETQLLEILPPQVHPVLMGRADFGGGVGFTCPDLPAASATWGKLKALYRGSSR